MADARVLVLGVLKGQLDTGDTFGDAGLCPCKNHITHRPAAQLLGGGLAQHPADGVNDIGLAAAVRADDGGDAFGKIERRDIGKRLKACQF